MDHVDVWFNLVCRIQLSPAEHLEKHIAEEFRKVTGCYGTWPLTCRKFWCIWWLGSMLHITTHSTNSRLHVLIPFMVGSYISNQILHIHEVVGLRSVTDVWVSSLTRTAGIWRGVPSKLDTQIQHEILCVCAQLCPCSLQAEVKRSQAQDTVLEVCRHSSLLPVKKHTRCKRFIRCAYAYRTFTFSMACRACDKDGGATYDSAVGQFCLLCLKTCFIRAWILSLG